MADIAYEGIVEFFKLSGKKHKGPYSNSVNVPIIKLGLKSDSGESREFELPMNLPNNPFVVSLVESNLRGQKVIYEERYERKSYATGPTWKLKVESGNFSGIEYLLEETTDF